MISSASYRLRNPAWLLALAASAGLFTACDGSSPGTGDQQNLVPGRVTLQRMEYGRLVDIYQYRIVDPAGANDRRDVTDRTPVLVERNVLVNSGISSQSLFDAAGNERKEADFRFLPFDVGTGHPELMILWDEQLESDRFRAALAEAQSNLVPLANAWRGQNTSSNPIPVMPRNASLALVFDNDVGVDEKFFRLNPSVVQLLEFRADPNVVGGSALSTLAARILPKGNRIIIDVTIIGGEVIGTSSNGLPISLDNITANLRVALPSRGSASPALFVEVDVVPDLNGIDSRGNAAVIRDFRSGNPSDGRLETLADLESPKIVALHEMGIKAIDEATNVLTINKRFNQVVMRGRVPFVDGPYKTNGLPAGPFEAPDRALGNGDIIFQDVEDPVTGARFMMRAEIIENVDLGSAKDDPLLGLAADGSDGATLTQVRVRVSSLTVTDEDGREWRFQSSSLPLGAGCQVRSYYYHDLEMGGVQTGDAQRVEQFLVIEPEPPKLVGGQPVVVGTKVDPLSTFGLRFSEPMDLETVDSLGNFFISNDTLSGTDVAALMASPKAAALSIQGSRLFDVNRDGTLLRLTPPLGLFHVPGGAGEKYWTHLMLDATGITDLSGNPVDIGDDALSPAESFSVQFQLDPDADKNLVFSRVMRFADGDEDGTPPGNLDFFGQFLLNDGRLTAASAVRFSRTADNQNLGGITRWDRGECAMIGDPAASPPTSTTFVPPTIIPGGVRYQTPFMFAINPLPPIPFLPDPRVGRVAEPHQPRGSRLQMAYIEDDFSLSYKNPAEFMIDVEQLYWSPFADDEVLFDIFDRYTMTMTHSDKRPDLRFFLSGGPAGSTCELAAASLRSGLSLVFADNYLRGADLTKVVEDQVYTINPNEAFRAPTGTKFVPYPKFQQTFTWRDSTQVTWDMVNDVVVGLGGARDAAAQPPANDMTTFIDSPWITDAPPQPQLYPPGALWVMDPADFVGNRTRDHDPVALPLLVDFQVFPDDVANGFASGANAFQIGLMGTILGGDYYQQGFNFPFIRVHTSGGNDPINGPVLIDPLNVLTATGGWIFDAGYGDPAQGLFKAPPGDNHIHWAQVDFIRKDSTVTFGFFDTELPNQHSIASGALGTSVPWPGLAEPSGFPDFQSAAGALGGVTLRPADVTVIMDPPINRQPAGTHLVLEIRGARTFANTVIYDAQEDDAYDTRGNLLNPNYACEAYRYASPNANLTISDPRIVADGLTPYVLIDQADSIRDLKGFLPRYLNLRLIMQNNVEVTPAVSPSLNGMAIIFRMDVEN